MGVGFGGGLVWAHKPWEGWNKLEKVTSGGDVYLALESNSI